MPSPRPAHVDPLENWKNLHTELIWAYEGPVEEYPNCRYPDSPSVAWLIRKGTVKLSFASHQEVHRADRWVFPRAEEGWQEFSSDADILSIRFIAQWHTGDLFFDRSKSISVQADKLPNLTKSSKQLVRSINFHFPGISDLLRYAPGTPERHFEFQYELSKWMLAYTQAMRELGMEPHVVEQLDDRVRKALNYMETHNRSRPPDEKKIADFVGISVTHLNRLFHQSLGKTPVRYWEDKRIQTAEYSLRESSKSVKTIAYDLGFSSLSHFSSWTRKKFGKSPRELRK